MGHSLGGAAAVKVYQVDSRCKAGIDVDGALFGKENEKLQPIKSPFMFLLSKDFVDPDLLSEKDLEKSKTSRKEWNDLVTNQNKEVDTLLKGIGKDGHKVIISEAKHMSFSDNILLKWPLSKLFGWLLVGTPIKLEL